LPEGKGELSVFTSEELVAIPESRLTPELVTRYRQEGSWRDVTLDGYLAAALAAGPDKLAAVSVDGQTGERKASASYGELNELVNRLVGGLSRLGVGPGDTVSLMLPNRMEFGALIFAVSRLGAVYSGIPVSYGEKDVAFMLRRARTKVLVIPSGFRRTDHVAMARRLLSETPELGHIVVLGDEVPGEPGWQSFEELASAQPLDPPAVVDPGSLAHVGFTSGTTGEPKGVMNTHQMLDFVCRRWVEHQGKEMLDRDTVNLIPSPVGHHTGLLWGVLMTALLGGTAVYLDRWTPEVVAEVIRREGITAMLGAPTFLQDLVRLPGIDAKTFPSLRIISIPGAPIPRSLVPQAREMLGCFICPAWGMTEWGIGISASPRLPQERVDETDGVPVEGCEVRVVEDTGEPASPGQMGDLQIRGPGLFAGYLARPDFTAEAIVNGWFQTGDLAIVHEDGYVSLVGRSKDIVIRGGENIPVHRLENLLYEHPAIADVAVVGVPDERLGERACAVVVLEPDQHLALEDVTEYLLGEGLSKHFLPERLELMEELPKTQSGKIRKFEIRNWLAPSAEQQPDEHAQAR
jgi:cyclohexanecarboxylate-CoA ligase